VFDAPDNVWFALEIECISESFSCSGSIIKSARANSMEHLLRLPTDSRFSHSVVGVYFVESGAIA
jgi:hypothetical protein